MLLTDLWILLPDRLFFWLVRQFHLEEGLAWIIFLGESDEPLS